MYIYSSRIYYITYITLSKKYLCNYIHIIGFDIFLEAGSVVANSLLAWRTTVSYLKMQLKVIRFKEKDQGYWFQIVSTERDAGAEKASKDAENSTHDPGVGSPLPLDLGGNYSFAVWTVDRHLIVAKYLPLHVIDIDWGWRSNWTWDIVSARDMYVSGIIGSYGVTLHNRNLVISLKWKH